MESETAATLRELIRKAAPHKLEGEVRDDQSFGDDGLGFDSIARLELLMEINIVLGVTLPVELFADPGLTVGALVRQVVPSGP